VERFIKRHREFLHGLEINGLRGWAENLQVLEMSAAFRLPAVSGGDRHGNEPNAILNLTNASTCSEFVEEVRLKGRSEILLMPQYRQSRALRLIDSACDIVGDYPKHSLGLHRWSDRVFYRCEDSTVRSLTEVWAGRPPLAIRSFIALSRLVRHFPLQLALRFAFGMEELA
jgi:hypothetical protein